MSNRRALEKTHELLLQALRHREQEILQYLLILGPAIGGFFWLLRWRKEDSGLFIAGTVGVVLLLLLGALYSLALGYNYRYITLQLSKLEAQLEIKDAMLKGWQTSRYSISHVNQSDVPWCMPPEVIAVFFWAFTSGIPVVATTACLLKPAGCCLILVFGVTVALSLVLILIRGRSLGRKLQELRHKEQAETTPPDPAGSSAETLRHET